MTSALADGETAAAMLASEASSEPEAGLEQAALCCQSCGSESLTLSRRQRKPSWSVLLDLDSQCSPWWYAESQEREEKRLWDQAMGEGFYDWYVAHVLGPSESARDGIETSDCPQVQLRLPGMELEREQAGRFYADSF
jgi:hypothetical protein